MLDHMTAHCISIHGTENIMLSHEKDCSGSGTRIFLFYMLLIVVAVVQEYSCFILCWLILNVYLFMIFAAYYDSDWNVLTLLVTRLVTWLIRWEVTWYRWKVHSSIAIRPVQTVTVLKIVPVQSKSTWYRKLKSAYSRSNRFQFCSKQECCDNI